MTNFTKKQLMRQDFADNKIFELMQELIPDGKKLKWDINVIGSVREVIRKYLADEKRIVSNMKFYPFLRV